MTAKYTREDIKTPASFFELLIKIDRRKKAISQSPTSDKYNYRK